jgi:hypothetical protein
LLCFLRYNLYIAAYHLNKGAGMNDDTNGDSTQNPKPDSDDNNQ